MKILIIEDEPSLRQSIRQYLEHQGYVCETAAILEQGWRK
jgi:DNA-binding response OmpR family regulator